MSTPHNLSIRHQTPSTPPHHPPLTPSAPISCSLHTYSCHPYSIIIPTRTARLSNYRTSDNDNIIQVTMRDEKTRASTRLNHLSSRKTSYYPSANSAPYFVAHVTVGCTYFMRFEWHSRPMIFVLMYGTTGATAITSTQRFNHAAKKGFIFQDCW